MQDIATAFHDYFNGRDTKFDFSVREAGRLLEFMRTDHPEQFDFEFEPPPPGFISFQLFMDRYSRWGYRIVDFHFRINNEELVHYQRHPDNLILPMLIKHCDPDDYIIKDSQIYFRKGVKRLLREMEDEMIRVIKSSFGDATSAIENQ
jgi:hypothetical protein